MSGNAGEDAVDVFGLSTVGAASTLGQTVKDAAGHQRASLAEGKVLG